MNRTIRAIFSDKPAENARVPDTPMVSAWSLIVKHKGELRDGALHVVSTPNRDTAVMVHRITGRSRLWQSLGCGAWALL